MTLIITIDLAACNLTTGNWLCSKPGCDKDCYIERDGRIHDYCSKTHADEHKKMKGSWPWTSTSSSHHHGTQSRLTGGSSNQTAMAIGMQPVLIFTLV